MSRPCPPPNWRDPASAAPRHHEALLLLPGAAVSSFTALKAAYEPAFSTSLSELWASVKGTKRSAVLDIAVAVSGLVPSDARQRNRVFDHLQRLLADVYKLVGLVSVKRHIELDGPGGVDARVFFVDRTKPIGSRAAGSPQIGPVVSLASLAASRRAWKVIYSVDSPQGDDFLREMRQAVDQETGLGAQLNIQRLPGTNDGHPPGLEIEESTSHSTPHYHVAVGGTFDHLHTGHKLLLTATLLALDPYVGQFPSPMRVMTIGITGDEMLVNKQYSEFLESWVERWNGVWEFLQSIIDFFPPGTPKQIYMDYSATSKTKGATALIGESESLKLRAVPIADPFGPTITDQDITALVVSKETRSGGKSVNDERAKKGWETLEVFEVDVLDLSEPEAAKSNASMETFESKISSTEIRKRRMNLAKGSPSL
ncbi:predicted protein [Uncinocarpus reesii 1704]|uniref:Cytidyltransferase-like domain-containing protein n=1 Tax=Uncinocarpus reesii (strain UAMH 1704) TaxID=336963 RepID=C4JHU3_UNCRE|nr:uncharacterized protein UREG_02779 [Uncinocarpus reesii 1704]EEP77930.1 predicted protein [Uncinocarpus reesii 1704]